MSGKIETRMEKAMVSMIKVLVLNNKIATFH